MGVHFSDDKSAESGRTPVRHPSKSFLVGTNHDVTRQKGVIGRPALQHAGVDVASRPGRGKSETDPQGRGELLHQTVRNLSPDNSVRFRQGTVFVEKPVRGCGTCQRCRKNQRSATSNYNFVFFFTWSFSIILSIILPGQGFSYV